MGACGRASNSSSSRKAGNAAEGNPWSAVMAARRRSTFPVIRPSLAGRRGCCSPAGSERLSLGRQSVSRETATGDDLAAHWFAAPRIASAGNYAVRAFHVKRQDPRCRRRKVPVVAAAPTRQTTSGSDRPARQPFHVKRSPVASPVARRSRRQPVKRLAPPPRAFHVKRSGASESRRRPAAGWVLTGITRTAQRTSQTDAFGSVHVRRPGTPWCLAASRDRARGPGHGHPSDRFT